MKWFSRERAVLAVLILVGAGVFLTGIDWGLPSRRVDRYLFGDRPAWTGAEVQRLIAGAAGGATWDDRRKGADVDADPLAPVDRPVVLNATDADRAQIVRRYRLFTYQPDEMITLMALARMRPSQGDLDPALYQYGGLWIYPVGALLKAAAVVGLVDLRGGGEGVAYYLDHPEAFGRFYVVARFYVVGWALVGVWAVFRIVRRIVGGVMIPSAGALCFIAMPVVVNMAHEAKPHLPGAVLVLLAVLAAARFVEMGTRRAWVGAAVFCGASFGMVLSNLLAFAILPAMTLLRPMAWRERCRVTLLAVLIGGAVYAVTNPYVVIHQFVGREVFESNIRNSTAMYEVGRPVEGLLNVAVLIPEGTSPVLALSGVAGAILLGVRAVRHRADHSPPAVRRRATGMLLAVPAGLTAVQMALLGAGKPGEFGRFLLVPATFLAVEAVAAVATFVRRPAVRHVALAVLLLTTAAAGGVYLVGFVRDSRDTTTRLAAAEQIEAARAQGARPLAVTRVPAPYAVPPVNLFDWDVVLLPQNRTSSGPPPEGPWMRVRENDVRPGPDTVASRIFRWFTSARISWANKSFELTPLEPSPATRPAAAPAKSTVLE